jgi:hypothetical protein
MELLELLILSELLDIELLDRLWLLDEVDWLLDELDWLLAD